MRYCVVDAKQLFDAVRDKLDGKDVSAFGKQLLATEGIFEPEDASKPKSAASSSD
jgi:hypothetical protein